MAIGINVTFECDIRRFKQHSLIIQAGNTFVRLAIRVKKAKDDSETLTGDLQRLQSITAKAEARLDRRRATLRAIEGK